MLFGSIAPLLLFARSFATAASASDRIINVPLTDPGIVLGGHSYYNATLCGGGISLPGKGDSLAYSFNGSDIQLDFVVVPREDYGNFTVWPDGLVIESGYHLLWARPETLDCNFRDFTSFSNSARYQLRQDLHTLNLTNIRNTNGGGGIFVVGISYFPEPLDSNIKIWGAERNRASHMSQRALIFTTTFSSVVGLLLIACLVL